MVKLTDIKRNFKRNKLAYLYLLPSFIVMLMVIVYPFAYNVVLSFTNMNLTHFKQYDFVGFDNYATIIKDIFNVRGIFQDFYRKIFAEPTMLGIIFKNLLWTVINIFFHVTIGVFLAILLNRKLRGRGVFRTLLILPWAIPQYIAALTWRGMFQYEYGAINLILKKFLFFSPVEWQSTPLGSFASVVITNIWLGFPFMMIVALGGLQSIPKEMYEAADIDGANWYHKLRNITIPLIKPVMIPAVSLGIIWTFNNFNVIWLVSNGGRPSDSTHIMVSYVYKAVFNYYRYGYAAAFSMVIFFILLIIIIFYMKKTRATEGVY